MHRRDWSLLLILAAIWGSSYMFIKIGLREMSPSMVVFLRVALGAAVLIPIAARRGALRLTGSVWGILALVAVVQVAVPFVLIAEGEEEISSSLAGILVASVPIFSAILAIFFDHEERSQGLRGVGVLVGIVGVVLLFGVDLSESSALLLGGGAVVLASLGYAIGGLLVKKRLGSVQPIGVATLVLAISALLTAPAAIATAPAEMPSAGPIAAVVALGLLGTGVAFAIFYGLIARVGPSRAFIVTYLAPGFAVIYGATLLGEAITVATVAGLVLILGGSYLAAEGKLPGRSVPEPIRGDHPAAGGFVPERESAAP
ncbi:MAG: DMT family transporter [Solirubrobacterales bacterium]